MDNAIYKLWAKKSHDPSVNLWLPLIIHLTDTAEAARQLFDKWISLNVIQKISKGILINDNAVNDEFVKHIVTFLAITHDLGKASPVFQAKAGIKPSEMDEILFNALIDEGMTFQNNYKDSPKTRHELISHEILRRNGAGDSICVVISGHHGKPPEKSQLLTLNQLYKKYCGFNDARWRKLQDELYQYSLEFSGLDKETISTIYITRPMQALLSGIVILCDWIASDSYLFPLIDMDRYAADSVCRANRAFDILNLPERWEIIPDFDDLFERRFAIENAYPVQSAAQRIAQIDPAIMIIEAPMGEGKTEAALAAAEILAYNRQCRGIFFALPTQATTNAMFARVLNWIKKFDSAGNQYSVRLSHGKADLNDDYQLIKLSSAMDVDEDSNSVIVHEWLSGRKKGMLTDFTIGTIDHVLMAGLKQKHLVLRHLGLAGKVVIIDEVHAYDTYMNSYLQNALKWLGSYNTPVIVLSATLPADRRSELMNSYLHAEDAALEPMENRDWASSIAYPVITFAKDGKVRQTEIQSQRPRLDVILRRLDESNLSEVLIKDLSEGGCVGIIVNTVKRAQKIFASISEQFSEIGKEIIHARLLSIDRAEREQRIIGKLGPKTISDNRAEAYIVVGTQVLEQSLDIDFDVLITDLCPMDLLLQRLGRLHRHIRKRPEKLMKPVCYVLGADSPDFESGASVVYGKYLLMRTRAYLPERLLLPDDIPRLVAGVYGTDDKKPLEYYSREEYEAAREEWNKKQEQQKKDAADFQISAPIVESNTLLNWLNTPIKDDSEKRGEAAVRDSVDSIEVIVIQQRNNGLYMLPWVDNGRSLPIIIPDDDTAKVLAGCCVRLPALFGGEWIIDKAINELEEKMNSIGLVKTWYQSPFLKGALTLILDESMEAMLCGYRIKYDKELGLIHEKEV